MGNRPKVKMIAGLTQASTCAGRMVQWSKKYWFKREGTNTTHWEMGRKYLFCIYFIFRRRNQANTITAHTYKANT